MESRGSLLGGSAGLQGGSPTQRTFREEHTRTVVCRLGGLPVARGAGELLRGLLPFLPTLIQSRSTSTCRTRWAPHEISLTNRALLKERLKAKPLVWHFQKQPAGVVGAEVRPETRMVLWMPEATRVPVLHGGVGGGGVDLP